VTEPLTVAPPPREVPPSPESDMSPISAMSLVNVVLRYRVLILVLSLGLGFYMGFRSITSRKSYTAEAQFMPKGATGQGGLRDVAARFGVNIGGGDASQSPQLYTDLLETKGLLWPVAQKQYSIRTDSGVVSGDLIRIFRIRNPRPIVVKVKVIERLQGAIKATMTPKTGVIKVAVTTGYPDLSLQIAQNLLDQVNIYNLSNRQQQAASERAFIEKELAEKGAELRASEGSLESFLERNRQYRTSPELMLEYGRIQREVDRRNATYSGLLTARETARIEEVRDLPVINVIEAPEMPIGPNPRGGVKKTAIGLLVGFMIGCLLAFAGDRMARNREAQTDDFLEFTELRREALGDLTHPWRPLVRGFRSRRKA
jgi:uncharacterized protein involved in exopolysaccharide biosynthesis